MLVPRRTTFEPLKEPSSPDKETVAGHLREVGWPSSLTRTRLSVHPSELPETHPPGLGPAALRITLGYGNNTYFIISLRHLQTQTRRRIGDIVDQACSLFYLAPQKGTMVGGSSSPPQLDEEET